MRDIASVLQRAYDHIGALRARSHSPRLPTATVFCADVSGPPQAPELAQSLPQAFGEGQSSAQATGRRFVRNSFRPVSKIPEIAELISQSASRHKRAVSAPDLSSAFRDHSAMGSKLKPGLSRRADDAREVTDGKQDVSDRAVSFTWLHTPREDWLTIGRQRSVSETSGKSWLARARS